MSELQCSDLHSFQTMVTCTHTVKDPR